MRETRTSQSALSRVSGVRQPSISKFLSGKLEMSDEQLNRLLCCMGYRLEVIRRPVVPKLTRSERRSWILHRQLSSHLTASSLQQWQPIIERNLQRLRSTVTGQPHSRNLDRWTLLVENRDVPGLHRVLTGLDRASIEMREVSPMGGLLPESERQAVLKEDELPAAAAMSVEAHDGRGERTQPGAVAAQVNDPRCQSSGLTGHSTHRRANYTRRAALR